MREKNAKIVKKREYLEGKLSLEDNFSEKKDQLFSLIKSFSDGIMVFNEKKEIFLINPQLENILNIKSKDIIGKSISDFKNFPQLVSFSDFLEKNKTIYRQELKIKEDLFLEISSSKIEGLGTIVILHNITREKLIEKMKTEFVTISAHQLRTPLSEAKWTLRMILDGDLGEITQEQRDLLNKLYESNERMIFLINGLLDISFIERESYLFRPTLGDLQTVIDFVVDSCRKDAAKKNLKLEFKKPTQKIPKTIFDIERMKIAFRNLLDNAIKYTPNGGSIKISLLLKEQEIEVSIKDTGTGISEDEKEKLFNKFFRGARAKKIEVDGLGLGLFIARNIICTHGGKIWFKSEENRGSTFYFTLPIKEEFGEFLKSF